MIEQDIKINAVKLMNTKPHVHSALQCIFVFKGAVKVHIEGKCLPLNADDLIVVNANELHWIETDQPNIVLDLRVEQDYVRRESPQFYQKKVECHCIGHSDESSNYYGLKRALTRMLYIAAQKNKGYQLDFKAELLRFLHILFTHFLIDSSERTNKKKSDKANDIEDILNYINENYQQTITLESIAHKAYMSVPYFSKFFKKNTGKGFREHLTMLRLNRSLNQLLHTENPIIKIAMDCGFANAKSYNEAFKREFKDTPGIYRKKMAQTAAAKSLLSEGSGLDLEIGAELSEVVRYLKKYDSSIEYKSTNKVKYEIDFCDQPIDTLKAQSNILNIGKIETAGYTNLLNQLDVLRNNLSIHYICFDLENHFISSSISYNIIICNPFFRIIEKLMKNDMYPFIKIKPEPRYQSMSCEEVIQDVTDKIKTFCECIKTAYQREFLQKWKFCICLDYSWPREIRYCFYKTVFKELKKRLSRAEVGYYALEKDERMYYEAFQHFLQFASDLEVLPEFISFGVFPRYKRVSYVSDKLFYDEIRNCYRNTITGIKKCYQMVEQRCPDLYMLEWNTLMGSIEGQTILYFRNGIILNALLDVNKEVVGSGFWSSSDVASIYSGEPPMEDLALYMLGDVRRPVYPVVEILGRMGENILRREENFLFSRTKDNEYALLLWNPKYLNPNYFLDDSVIDSLSQCVELVITGIEPARYQVKRICCDRKQSGVITQIENAGYPDYTDKDAFDYIQYNISNGLSIYEENIRTGSYVINTTLLYNSVVLYLFRRTWQ